MKPLTLSGGTTHPSAPRLLRVPRGSAQGAALGISAGLVLTQILPLIPVAAGMLGLEQQGVAHGQE